MMAKDRAWRYQTPLEVVSALSPFVKQGATAKSSPESSLETTKTSGVQVVPVEGPVAWDLLTESVIAATRPQKSGADGKRPSGAVPPISRTGWLMGDALAASLLLLGLLGYWLANVLFRVETPNGILVVEMNDDEVEARIKNGKLILTGPDSKLRYTLTPSDRRKKLEAGPYKIRVEGADGLLLDTSEFTIKKGRQVIVRVKLDPKAAGKKGPSGKPDAPVKTNPSKLYLYDLKEFDIEVLDGRFRNGYDENGITVRGERFKKGLWTHPFPDRDAHVKYRLDGLDAFVFEAKVAINDTALDGSASPLTFRVLGDDKVLWTSQPVRFSHQTQDCRVKVEGIHVLELRVACQKDHRSAIAVWVDPYLLSTKPSPP
jgi:hypothetical protein